LLNRHPIFWIEDPNYLWAVLAASALTIAYVRYKKPPWEALLIADALGLALFSISGAQLAEQRELSGIIVVVMGMITGAAGGVIRDVLITEIPILFRADETLYATPVIIGVSCYLLMQDAGVERTVAALCGMLIVAAIRFAAIIWTIKLPVFRVNEYIRSVGR